LVTKLVLVFTLPAKIDILRQVSYFFEKKAGKDMIGLSLPILIDGTN